MSVEHGLTSLTSARSRAGRLTPALIALVLCGPLSIQELAAQNLTEAHYRWRNDDGGEGSGSSPHQVSETSDDTTASASDVLVAGMSITPGAEDYHVWFSGSVEGTDTNSRQFVSLYVNGAQLPHTEREIFTEPSIPNTSFPVALHARVTGILAGQAIDVRWRTTVPTATMHERTLVVTPINPANSTEVSATLDDTTVSATDVLASGMSITPGAGDYHVWFSSSVEGTTAPSTQNVSLYVNGVQVPHTERQILTETSIPDTSFPVALHARITGVLAGQAIDVRWRTTAGTATMHERTLVVEKLSSSFGASWAALEDTKLTALAKNTIRRVRFEVSNEGGLSSGPVAYELQVAETATCSAGAYATVPTAASGHWQVIDSTFLTDGEATFNISPGLTDEATTFVAGQLKDAGNTTGSITLDPDEHTEIEFSVQATTNATNGGDYCFRLYDATNIQILNTYSVYAEVSLVGDDLTQIHYRWRNDDGGEVGANSPLQASETTDDTTGSASDVLVSGMTITPGAGDYHVWFSGSVEGTATNSTQFVSLYVNGAQLPHTERQILTEGSILNTSFPVATHALVTGVLAGQAIEARWRTTAPTATIHERTLVVTPINPADSTQASATADDTTVSTSDVVASGMSLTPGAGDYHVWFSGSVENTIPVPAQNEYQFVSIYLDGVQISQSERQITMEESIPDTSFPVATHARLTGVTAGQIIDVRWRTTGGTATMHERTLLVTQITPADTAEVNATADDTTGSASDIVAGGMTITPGAGDYLVWFTASVEGTSGDSRQHVSLYVNGAQLPHTEREILNEGSIDPTSFPVATHAYVPGVLAGQAIDVRWRTTAPTATMHERTLVIEKLSGATGATFAAAEDTKLTGLAKNTIKRVRLEVSNEGGLTSGPVAYELQVAETATCSAGTYTTVPTDTSGHWQVTDSSFITDGEPTSNIFPGLTDEATTFVAGELRDAANTTGSITLNPDELTELEFSVQATTNATDGGDYCFRLYDATNARLLDTYTVYAEVSLAGGAVSLDLADHALSQIGDKLTTTSPVTDMLFRFKLTRSGTVTVDNLRVNFTTGGGVVNGDVSAGELWVDNNNDGAIDVGDTLIQGAVVPSAGVLVFTTDFSPALAGTNYLVRATIGNLLGGDTTTFSLGVADIDELEVVTETGAISSATHTQDAAGVIYYSVGTNAADLKSGLPTLTLSGGTATLSVAQPDTIGVGDEITYNGSTKAYISGRLGPSVYTATTATAGIPPDVAGATVNSILRAFNSLTAATTGSADASHLNTADLVAGGFQLNWAGYNDGPDPSSGVRIQEPWVTGPSNFIRLFTPTDTTQVGTSQRHNGTAGSGYRIAPTVSPPLGTYNLLAVSNATGYVRIDGIEIDGSNVTNAESVRGILVSDTVDAMEDNRISHCLIHDLTNSIIDESDGSHVRGIRLSDTNNSKVSNNIIYNLTNVSTNVDSRVIAILANKAGKSRYVYNNTVYNIRSTAGTGDAIGIDDRGGSTVFARNNYVGLVEGLVLQNVILAPLPPRATTSPRTLPRRAREVRSTKPPTPRTSSALPEAAKTSTC